MAIVYQLNATVNNPLAVSVTYAWAMISGPAAAVFNNSTIEDPLVTLPIYGVYVLQITVTGGADIVTDQVQVSYSSANLPPAVNAGPDQTIVGGFLTFSVSGVATDPESAPMTYLWSQVSGPGSATITSPTALNTNITLIPGNGTWVFKLEANDGTYVGSDTITVTQVPNSPPSVNPGVNQSVSASVASLSAIATDPESSPMTYLWTRISGPGTVVFSAPTALSSTATITVGGVYVLRMTAFDGYLSGYGEVQITYNVAPVITAQPLGAAVLSGQTHSMSVTISSNRYPAPTYQWYEGVSGITTTPVGTNSSSYTTPALVASKNYWVRVSNTAGSVDSNSAEASVPTAFVALDSTPLTIRSIQNIPALGRLAVLSEPIAFYRLVIRFWDTVLDQWVPGLEISISSSFTNPWMTVDSSSVYVTWAYNAPVLYQHLHRYSASTGALIWAWNPPHVWGGFTTVNGMYELGEGIALSGGYVYISLSGDSSSPEQGRIQAYDASTGARTGASWGPFGLPYSYPYGLVAGEAGKIYGAAGVIFKFDTTTKTTDWNTTTSNIWRSFKFVNGKILTNAHTGSVFGGEVVETNGVSTSRPGVTAYSVFHPSSGRYICLSNKSPAQLRFFDGSFTLLEQRALPTSAATLEVEGDKVYYGTPLGMNMINL